jgi:hypothetical protein
MIGINDLERSEVLDSTVSLDIDIASGPSE